MIVIIFDDKFDVALETAWLLCLGLWFWVEFGEDEGQNEDKAKEFE